MYATHPLTSLPHDSPFHPPPPPPPHPPQVRAIGRLLQVPEAFIKRHPFPGPGMGVRILGDVTEGDRLRVLQEVDEIYINTIKEFGLYDDIWQVRGGEGRWMLVFGGSGAFVAAGQGGETGLCHGEGMCSWAGAASVGFKVGFLHKPTS